MSNRKYDVSEEKLKNLQRKDALNDSEEYNISDDTYNRRPLTRQYVEDDVITKGSEFVDDEELNKQATIKCKCTEAQEFQHILARKEKALKKKI